MMTHGRTLNHIEGWALPPQASLLTPQSFPEIMELADNFRKFARTASSLPTRSLNMIAPSRGVERTVSAAV
jgi:hypothetical protein